MRASSNKEGGFRFSKETKQRKISFHEKRLPTDRVRGTGEKEENEEKCWGK